MAVVVHAAVVKSESSMQTVLLLPLLLHVLVCVSDVVGHTIETLA
jgi:hypothetical protein